jgi:hypothetical protein
MGELTKLAAENLGTFRSSALKVHEGAQEFKSMNY